MLSCQFLLFVEVPTNHSEQRKNSLRLEPQTITTPSPTNVVRRIFIFNFTTQGRVRSLHYEIQLVWSEILGGGYTRSFPIHSIPEILKIDFY